MNRVQIGLAIMLFMLLCNYSINIHTGIPYKTFRSELWADRAGYHVYLPALFIYQFSANQFPDSIEEFTGHGYKLDNDKVQTKYTYGVALLQAPFFLGAHILTQLRNQTPDGYSIYYRNAVDIAAIFYLIFGMLLLYLSIINFSSSRKWVVLLALTSLFLGSNVYYYAIMEGGMSHIYSFFLFSVLIFINAKWPKDKSHLWVWVAESLIVSLIVLIRPINLVFATLPIFWNTNTFAELRQHIFYQLRPKRLLVWLICITLVALPQLMYWKYAYGSFIKDTYTNEGFVNLTKPYVFGVLFAPANGLLPYSVIMIGVLFGCLFLLRANHWMGKLCLMHFVGIVYLTASWYTWQFGCSCGMRNMVEYSSILAFPLTIFFDKVIYQTPKVPKVIILVVLTLLVMINLKVNYHFYGCYFTGTWNWDDYLKTLFYDL